MIDYDAYPDRVSAREDAQRLAIDLGHMVEVDVFDGRSLQQIADANAKNGTPALQEAGYIIGSLAVESANTPETSSE